MRGSGRCTNINLSLDMGCFGVGNANTGAAALFSEGNSLEGTRWEWSVLPAAEEMSTSVLQVGSGWQTTASTTASLPPCYITVLEMTDDKFGQILYSRCLVHSN